MATEAQASQKIEEATHFIKKIDIIHNPEYYELLEDYKLPIFVRSSPKDFYRQGFLDNGRHRIELKSPE